MADLLNVPSTVDVEMVSGDSKVIRVRMLVNEVTPNGTRRVPADLSEVTSIIWKMSKKANSDAVILKTMEGSGCTTILLDGFWYVDINLLEEDTKPTNGDPQIVGSFYHECQVKRPGLTDTPFNGTITLKQDSI